MELTKEVNYGVMQASQIIQAWPEESKEAAQLVIKQYGEPDKMQETRLTGHKPGPWKRIVTSKTFYLHNFPAPHSRAGAEGRLGVSASRLESAATSRPAICGLACSAGRPILI